MAQPVWDLTNLELRVRERADMVNSTFVSSAEIGRWLEAAWQELFGLLAGEKPEMFRADASVTTTAGVDALVLPNTGKKVHAVRLMDGVCNPFLTPVSLRERALFSVQRNGKPAGYELTGSYPMGLWTLYLVPTPDAAYTVRYMYTPQVSLTDVASFVNAIGMDVEWSEFLVNSASTKARDKEESDCSVLLAERVALLDSIKRSWTPVDLAEAARVVRVAGVRSSFRGASDDPVWEEEYLD